MLPGPAASACGRIDIVVAASVLVLWAPGSVHRDCAWHGDRLPRIDCQHAETAAEPQGDDRIDGKHRLFELHGVRTPYVCQRDDSAFFAGLFIPDAHHHDPRDDHRPDLDRQPVRIETEDQYSLALCAGIYFDVCERRC